MSQDQLLASAPFEPVLTWRALCRSRIAAAERELQAMIAILAGDLPMAARSAAMASWPLYSGTGLLYNHRSAPDLSVAVREATRRLISFADNPSDGADRTTRSATGE